MRASSRLIRAEQVILNAKRELGSLLAEGSTDPNPDVEELRHILDLMNAAQGVYEQAVGFGAGETGQELAADFAAVPATIVREATTPAPARYGGTAEYPRFFHDGDSLLRVGWSPKKRATYDQRVPHGSLEQVVDALERIGAKRDFSMKILVSSLPNHLSPYIPYATLSWLRREGVVESRPGDKYRVAYNGNLKSEIERRLSMLPEP